MTLLSLNLTVLAVKLHYVTFEVITRNITRSVIIVISHWFIWVFYEPGFLLIRRSLVRAQVEEPPKKAVSKAMLFPFIRHYLSRWGPLGDFLPSNLIELLHVYYTVEGPSQGFSSQSKHHQKSSSLRALVPCQAAKSHFMAVVISSALAAQLVLRICSSRR